MENSLTNYPCGKDVYINMANSDSNCHRKKRSYAVKKVKDSNFLICINCPYNKEPKS